MASFCRRLVARVGTAASVGAAASLYHVHHHRSIAEPAERASDEPYDALVIGGGVVGLACRADLRKTPLSYERNPLSYYNSTS